MTKTSWTPTSPVADERRTPTARARLGDGFELHHPSVRAAGRQLQVDRLAAAAVVLGRAWASTRVGVAAVTTNPTAYTRRWPSWAISKRTSPACTSASASVPTQSAAGALQQRLQVHRPGKLAVADLVIVAADDADEADALVEVGDAQSRLSPRRRLLHDRVGDRELGEQTQVVEARELRQRQLAAVAVRARCQAVDALEHGPRAIGEAHGRVVQYPARAGRRGWPDGRCDRWPSPGSAWPRTPRTSACSSG